MALTDIQRVRLKTSDRPVQQNETQTSNGAAVLQLDSPRIDSASPVKVWVGGTLKTQTVDYSIDYDAATITFVSAPADGATVLVQYWSVMYTDEEVQSFLDEANGNVTLASAINLFAWAADASKVAKIETSGGSASFGVTTLNLSVRAEQLRKSAQAYLDQYNTLEGGTGGVAEGITEIAWTNEEGWGIVRRSILSTALNG